MIKHDSQGFLVGELIDVTQRLVDGQVKGLDALARMDRNLAILVGQGGRGGGGGRAISPGAMRRSGVSSGSIKAMEPIGRSSYARSGSGGGTTKALAQVVASETARAVSRSQIARSASVSQIKRDSSGRFVKGAGRGGAASGDGDSSGGGGGGGSGQSGLIGTAAGNIKDAAIGATSGIDPAVNAMGELKQTLEPLGRGWKYAFGRIGEQKKERWYKRFLKALERKPSDKSSTMVVSGGGSGGGGFLGGLLGPALGLLGKGKGLMGLFKRVPILGALLAGGGAAASIFGGGSREEKYKGAGSAIGGGVGMVAGAALGSLLGPAGTIAGGYLGTMLGEKVGGAMGEWTRSLVDSDIPGKVVALAGEAWGKVAGLASSIADGSKALIQQAAGATMAVAGKANEAIKQATGVDVKASAAKAGSFVAENAHMLVPETIKKMGRAGLVMSEAISSGITSPSKLAMFMGQMSHESSGFTRTEEGLNYKSPKRLREVFGKYFKSDDEVAAAIAGGPQAIANKVYGGRMGNTQSGDGFRFRGRGYVQLTGRENYAAAGTALGIDLVSNPDLAADPSVAAKIATWYWKTRVSGVGKDGSIEDATKAINGGLNGLKDRQSETSRYQGVIAKNGLSNLPIPAMPSSTMPKIPSMPEVPTAGATSRQDNKPIVVVAGEVGQNVSDRGIAHKVTGGMGAS